MQKEHAHISEIVDQKDNEMAKTEDQDVETVHFPALDPAKADQLLDILPLAKIYDQRKRDPFERLTLATAYIGQRVSMAHQHE
ncbi:hypothetical protein [Mesorhizobium huakuii]|uniref:Uncharacterized protein n=1 Tax=Mesorhizobium huakuii TaxID=28104 RepID=A0A7G6T539_9HYPH|nr:hypothetical protein [Mesorhizobium huakuii]QND61871.1 hypothetical protein HB778_37500 [Mesorhizobium huakuii]QND69127.1 hypothetical protein HB777_35580 [Mesorhizobium loti]